MKGLGAWIGAAALAIGCCAPAQADSFVWEVSRDGAASHWIIGSVHMLPESAYPLPPAYAEAYDAADGLIFETDIASMAAPEFQSQVMALASAPQGLSAELNAKLSQQLGDYLGEASLPPTFCEPFRAWFCATMLQVVSLAQAGMLPDLGVDQHYFKQARDDGKTITWLEAPAEQMALLAGPSPEDSAMLKDTLRAFSTPGQHPRDMIEYWMLGNRAAVEAGVTLMVGAQPELSERLLIARNRAWIDLLEEKFSSGDTRWLLVAGAAHMVGPDSVPALLRARGFTVEAVD